MSITPTKGITIISMSSVNEETEKLLLLWVKEKQQLAGDTITETIIYEKSRIIYKELKKQKPVKRKAVSRVCLAECWPKECSKEKYQRIIELLTMTRHARNCTAGTVYTYHERKKDTTASGYGTQSQRVGKDSVKDFDCCCLTLQPCKNPVLTPQGYLYDKEVILEYILHQKREIARRLKAFKKQKLKSQSEMEELAKAEQEMKTGQFLEQEGHPITSKYNADKAASAHAREGSLSNMERGQSHKLPSFWIPSLTPKAAASKLQKPDEKVRCPMSGDVLRLKDLIDVRFTPINDRDSKTSLITKSARYVCPVTNDVLGNSVPCAVLKTSGNVVTMECVEKIIKKDMVDPTCGKPLTEKDIIPLKRGATGFSGTSSNLIATKAGPSLQA